MAEFEVERVGGELKRFGVEGSEVPFEVVSPYEPSGSQPKAIESLVQGVRDGDRYQVLLGVTGSGKTFTMAKNIEADAGHGSQQNACRSACERAQGILP